MATYVGNETAFSFWFGEQATAIEPARSSWPEIHDLADADASTDALPADELRRLGITQMPVHLYVPDHASMRRSASVITHQWGGRIPARSFLRVSRNVYMEAPIPCLVHMAGQLSQAELLMRCHQLCGTYRLYEEQIVTCRPLATKAELETYAASMSGVHGIKALRHQIPLVAEGAASPREAALAAALRQRLRDGGCGLPAFELNHPIKDENGGMTRYADVLFELLRIIIEYDSDLIHTGAEKIGMDAARRAQLEAEGYRVVTLTNWQIRQRDEFDAVIDLVRSWMGRGPLPLDDPAYAHAHAQLMDELFGQVR